MIFYAFGGYQEQFLGLYTKQKDNFSNYETNSFLGALSMRDHALRLKDVSQPIIFLIATIYLRMNLLRM